MDQVYEHVILSDVLQDDERFRKIIDEAIESRDVPAFKAYVNESTKKRTARTKQARAEAAEAEEYAKELGVADKLFGKSSTKKNGKKGGKDNSEDALAALIQKRQQDRRQDAEDFLDGVSERWGAKPSGKGKKGKKRTMEEEPDEAAFQAAAARLGKGKKSRN
jgi:DnaJ family protein C protein 9